MSRIIIALAFVLLAGTAHADHWTVKRMNEVVDQTNFIVGNHCSGTLISLEHRLILTNHHCITQYVSTRTKEKIKNGEIKKVQVEELRDVVVSQKAYADFREVGRSSWQATIVAKCKECDLALLQIRAEKIPQTYQSNVFAGKIVYRGDTVWAVGNPLLLDATISKGIISSVNRQFRVPWADNQEVPFIQMDAAIAGGSSGGALYSEHGELIGVPAAGIPAGAIGLAIPFAKIQSFLTDNCYESVWHHAPDVKDYKACTAEKAAKAKKDKTEKKAGLSINGAAMPARISSSEFNLRWGWHWLNGAVRPN